MSWHNEVHNDAGWFDILRRDRIARGVVCGTCGEWTEYCGCEPPEVQKKESGKIEGYERQSPTTCSVCGTRTGQHGFSFDKKKS